MQMASIRVSAHTSIRPESSTHEFEIVEVWESMLATLIEDLESSDCLPIEEIWALDCVNQGDSAILNEDTLGGVCESKLGSLREARY